MRQRVRVRLREAAGEVLGECLEGCWRDCGSCGQGWRCVWRVRAAVRCQLGWLGWEESQVETVM